MTAEEEVRGLWATAVHQVNFRTVASRAYYASFNRCMAHGIRHGYVASGTGADHGGIAEHLRRRDVAAPGGNLLYRVGSTRLPQLRKLRKQADYDRDSAFARGSAEASFNLMNDILDCLLEAERLAR